MQRGITGWKLGAEDRERLIALFPPHYPHIIADHITLRFGTDGETPLPAERSAEVIGEADDGKGVQALVVRIGGTTARGDGSHFHISWSLGAGRRAKESNDVITQGGWRAVDPPIQIAISPARWEG